MTIIDTKVHYF